ncbi:o-succinylbenzoate--CoA ligase [Yaniella flava]|uniref:O-succinylbenzoate--CoA ligase n=1 Tax=Yaniella flava TaxID=287930 RepID=A0ABN2UW77_9MICC
MRLTPIDAPDALDALTQALAVRDAGGVPLILDPRAHVPQGSLAFDLPQDAAWATLTSGTTGAPKIVVRTAASWEAAFGPLNAELGLQPGDGLWMPVHQVSSMALFSAAWAHESGLELIVPQKDPGLDRAAVAHVTPAWLGRMLDLIEAGEPTTVHTVLVGGDHVPEALLVRARQAGLRTITYAGAAELSFVAWDRGDGLRAFDGVSIRTSEGQLWVASPQMALGVLGGTLEHETLEGIEWATVGDRVTEHNGVLEFLGRADGAILTAGATVIPTDVEAIIAQHPGITASLVLGEPDALLGQRVVAWYEGDATIPELRDWVRSRLPKASRPLQWHRVDRLARTASGKIRRVVPEDS